MSFNRARRDRRRWQVSVELRGRSYRGVHKCALFSIHGPVHHDDLLGVISEQPLAANLCGDKQPRILSRDTWGRTSKDATTILRSPSRSKYKSERCRACSRRYEHTRGLGSTTSVAIFRLTRRPTRALFLFFDGEPMIRTTGRRDDCGM